MANTADDIKQLIAKPAVSHVSTVNSPVPLSDFYFIFVYRSTCPHCHRFAPVLRSFSNRFHIPVLAYSTDGGPLPGFQAKKLPPALFQLLFLNGGYAPAVPALFLANKVTHQVYAVLFGEANAPQLDVRMNTLIKHIGAHYVAS